MFAEAFSGFFSDFAVPATLEGVDVPSGVIFDAAYAEPLGTYAEATGPAVTVIASEVSSVAHGQTLIISPSALPERVVPGGNYIVRGVEPDGTGIVVLRLQKA